MINSAASEQDSIGNVINLTTTSPFSYDLGPLRGDVKQHVVAGNVRSIQPMQMTPEALTRTPYGLVNLGNTCYMNAVIQSLQACQLFRDTLSTKFSRIIHEKDAKDKLSKEIANIFHAQSGEILEPINLFNTICSLNSCTHYAMKKQQDCSELLLKLMEYWHEQNKDISEIFTGGMRSKVRCSHCHKTEGTWNDFMVLKLSLANWNLRKKDELCIQELISSWGREERLDERNKYKCENCQVSTKSFRTLNISNAPPILVAQIKRFTYTKGRNGTKLAHHVKFDNQLKIQEDSLQRGTQLITYNLKAVISHIGKTLSDGHYIATIRFDDDTDKWFCCRDDTWESLNWKEVLKQQAYLLFYEKENRNTVKQEEGEKPPLTDDSVNDAADFNVRDKQKLYRDDSAFLMYNLRQEAERLSYERLSKLTRKNLKLRGGMLPEREGPKDVQDKKEEDNDGPRDPPKKRDRSPESDNLITLRKKNGDKDEEPKTKRRNTNKLHEEADLKSNMEKTDLKPSMEENVIHQCENNVIEGTPLNCSSDSKLIRTDSPKNEDLEETQNPNPDKKGRSVERRWEIDSELVFQKIRNDKERERDRVKNDQIEGGQYPKDEQVREHAKEDRDNQQRRLTENEKVRKIENEAHCDKETTSKWSVLPEPTSLPFAYMHRKTPENSQFENDEVIFEGQVKSSEHQIDPAHAEGTPDVVEIKMKPPGSKNKPTEETHAEIFSGLETWKKKVMKQFSCLKTQLREDTEIWRQQIAKTSIHELANTLEATLLGVFNDVEKLKTITKELVKSSQKQAEVI